MPHPITIPAATIVVMRDTPDGAPELLMVERAGTMRFAGGALVFPGGRVDPGDHALAAGIDGDSDEIAARIAGIRETIEEAGVAIGMDLTAEALGAMRRRLHGGEALGPLLDAAAVRLDLDRLVPFARWLPLDLPHRVFDTRFYLARAPHGVTCEVDGSENVRLLWARAADVLDAAASGEARLIYPTRRNLERLAGFASFDAAMAHAHAHPVRTISPWIERRDGVDHLCIPEGAGYPVTAEPFDRVIRG
jgi:8-oxo-dGTP pyrophosphatase MutT (NUDIX family)